jgi:hypothetical protein
VFWSIVHIHRVASLIKLRFGTNIVVRPAPGSGTKHGSSPRLGLAPNMVIRPTAPESVIIARPKDLDSSVVARPK